MTNNGQIFSLLSYLDASRGNFHLDPSLTSDDSAALERSPFPFLTITDTDPLTQLIEARIRSDAGSEIARVFLLVQRDRYLLAKDALWPVNNRGIEDAWQKAFSFYSSENRDNSFITLAGQLDDQGGPAQLSSLFFCKTMRVFFHPPCPKCGAPLQQCEDEELLGKAGLQSYSVSLKRYLYCRTCATAGKLDFYVYELEPSDPQTLRDRSALIKKFKLLVEGNRNVEQFPCIGCPNYKDCYGADQRVLSRIVPFSFYPFHMFIFKAMSLNALDFLPLVSGAAFQELEAELENKGEYGRSSCVKNVRQGNLIKAPCLFDSGSRNFLEVLYLKLTFLAEVFQGISSGNEILRHPDLRLSLDNIWVNLPEHGSRLPFLWDFRVKFTDIFRQQADKTSSTGLQSAGSLFFMGLVWFYTLLVNRRQDMSKVYLSLRGILDMSSSDSSFSFDKYVHEGTSPVLLPSNILWEPEGKTVNNDMLPLWEKGLQAGWSVLNAGLYPSAGFSLDNFLEQLDKTREEIKGRLFSAAPADEQQPSREKDKAISNILKNIYDKWGPPAAVEEETLTETVMLSPGRADRKIPPPPSSEESDIVSSTVIISAGKAPASPETPAPEQPVKQDDILTETIIISPQGIKDTLKPSPVTPQKKPDTGPPETVIISAKDAAEALRPAGEQPGAAPETEEQKKKKEQDFLAETIILKPGELKGKGKK
jgi:hypothetical protein